MPSLSNDRRYGAEASLAVKAPVVAATTAAHGLTGLDPLDGVTLAAAERVLVKDQADPKQNGIYLADSGAWRRAPDFDGARDVVAGTRVYVASGALFGGMEFAQTTAGAIVVGHTALAFQPISALSDTQNRISTTRAIAIEGQTVFTLDYQVGGMLATVNGSVIDEADYTAADGLTITFAQGMNSGDAVALYSVNGGVNQPTAAFAARVGADVLSVTGAGAVYTVLFDMVEFDDGDDYDAATGVFIAPKTGRYQFNVTASLDNIGASVDELDLRLVTSARVFVAEAYHVDAVPERATLTLSVVAALDAGDTAYVTAQASGDAADMADIIGGTAAASHFSAFLIR